MACESHDTAQFEYFVMGLSTSCRVASFTILKAFSSEWPIAPASIHPVASSATEFMNVMAPFSSVAMTASPMFVNV